MNNRNIQFKSNQHNKIKKLDQTESPIVRYVSTTFKIQLNEEEGGI